MNEIQLKIADYLLADSYKRQGFIYTIPDTSYVTKRIEVERNDELYQPCIDYVCDIFMKEEIFKERTEKKRNFYQNRGFLIDLKGIDLQQEYGSYSAYYKKEKKKVKRAEKRETREYRIKVIGFWITSIGLAISIALNIYQALK